MFILLGAVISLLMSLAAGGPMIGGLVMIGVWAVVFTISFF
jgi:hypothetical protein